MLVESELESLEAACRQVPLTHNRYLATDLVATLLDTVVDYQQHTTTVRRAIEHFNATRWDEVRSLDDLEALFESFPNDREGNSALGQFLWGYNFWTRAEQLRGLVAFVRDRNIETLNDLRSWAESSCFAEFEGQVKGLGPVVYQWLIMRLGVETVKPDVHILRFVSRAIGRQASEREAIDSLIAVAGRMSIQANQLDWSIWENERSNGSPE